jgi:hypothetical protein
MNRSTHVGIELLYAAHKKLVADYRHAVAESHADPVRTSHGVAAEAMFRDFLRGFLPKKYGVTKGHIITADLDYDAAALEEWDIIIYDAMNSPVLSVRKTKDDNESAGNRAIPIEFAKAVIEVKATLTQAHCKKVTQKLLKLEKYRKIQDDERAAYECLPRYFSTAAVFFETKVETHEEYIKALAEFIPIAQGGGYHRFQGGLILEAHTHPGLSGTFNFHFFDDDELRHVLSNGAEVTDPFEVNAAPDHEGQKAYVASTGFHVDEFWPFLLDLLFVLNMGSIDLSPASSISTRYGSSERQGAWFPLFNKPASY